MLEGQELQWNPYTKQALAKISEPFKSANKILGWEHPHGAGLGFNQSIIEFVLKHQAFFVVKVLSENKMYWATWERVKGFLDTHNCDYEVSGKKLKVISWKIFVRVQDHSD